MVGRDGWMGQKSIQVIFLLVPVYLLVRQSKVLSARIAMGARSMLSCCVVFSFAPVRSLVEELPVQ